MDWLRGLSFFVDEASLGNFLRIFFALELLAIVSIPSVLLRRRGYPTAALAWIVSLFAFPAFGVLAWWAFGRTRMERKLRYRSAHRQDFVKLSGTPSLVSSRHFDNMLPARAWGSYAFTATDNQVELLFDGKQAFEYIETALLKAQESIHLHTYLFQLDETGHRICRILEQKARSGLKVRLLLDGFGSAQTIAKLRRRLTPAGVEVAVFMPSRLSPLFAPRFNFINHRKVIIVDHRLAICGGMNIGDEYRKVWRDLMLSLVGPCVQGLNHIVLDDWYFATKVALEAPDSTHLNPSENGTEVAVISSGPDSEPWIHDAYFTAINHAQESLYLVTPYFIPTQAILASLRTLAGRGVMVSIILPARSDVDIVKWASRSFYPQLVEAGVRIFEYQGSMLHAKALLVDDSLISVGTANIDNRSFRLNFEVSCFVEDRMLASQLMKWLSAIMENSRETTLKQLSEKGTITKLLESAAHLLSPLL